MTTDSERNPRAMPTVDSGSRGSRRRRHIPVPLIGVAMLFSGAALLAHITTGVSLRLALALSASTLCATIWIVWTRALPGGRLALRRTAAVGAIAGLAATAAYDLSRVLLIRIDHSAFNPFAAIPVFGLLLAGASAPPTLRVAAGTAFHLLNGIAFGTSFCLLLGTRGVLAGIAWGLALESLQLALFPGWLGIRQFREFAQISALGHVAYGTVLGLTCRSLMRRKEGI